MWEKYTIPPVLAVTTTWFSSLLCGWAFPVSCRRLSAVLLLLGGHLGSGLPPQPSASVIFVTSIQYLRKIVRDFTSDESVFQIWVSAFGLHTQRYLLREAQCAAWAEHWLKYISDQLRWCWQTERRHLGFWLLICYQDQRKELCLWFCCAPCHKLFSGFTCSKMGQFFQIAMSMLQPI